MGLLTPPQPGWPESVLSGPIFSGPVDFGCFSGEPQAIDFIRAFFVERRHQADKCPRAGQVSEIQTARAQAVNANHKGDWLGKFSVFSSELPVAPSTPMEPSPLHSSGRLRPLCLDSGFAFAAKSR